MKTNISHRALASVFAALLLPIMGCHAGKTQYVVMPPLQFRLGPAPTDPPTADQQSRLDSAVAELLAAPSLTPVERQRLVAKLIGDAPAPLPLTATDRQRLETYFAKDGNVFSENTVPNPAAGAQKQLLDALSDPATLTIDLSKTQAKFCGVAKPLCDKVPMFRSRALVRQITDARMERSKLSGQLAVSDGHYWYIFDSQKNAANQTRLTRLNVVRTVERDVTR